MDPTKKSWGPADGFPPGDEAGTKEWEAGHADGLANKDPEDTGNRIYMNGYEQGTFDFLTGGQRIY